MGTPTWELAVSEVIFGMPRLACGQYSQRYLLRGGSVANWLACWTQVQYGLGSNCSRDAVG